MKALVRFIQLQLIMMYASDTGCPRKTPVSLRLVKHKPIRSNWRWMGGVESKNGVQFRQAEQILSNKSTNLIL